MKLWNCVGGCFPFKWNNIVYILFVIIDYVEHLSIWILSKWKWQFCRKYSLLSTKYNKQWICVTNCYRKFFYCWLIMLNAIIGEYFHKNDTLWNYTQLHTWGTVPQLAGVVHRASRNEWAVEVELSTWNLSLMSNECMNTPE